MFLRSVTLCQMTLALVLCACGGRASSPDSPPGGPPLPSDPQQEGHPPRNEEDTAPFAAESRPVSEEPLTYEGIDVSSYQGQVDWARVKAAGLVFAFAKATQGVSEVDPEFARNWGGIRAAGLVRGAYHYMDPTEDPTRQAEHFLAIVKLEAGDLPPVLDVEVTEGLSVEDLDEAVRLWLDKVAAATGVRPILYSDLSFLDRDLARGFGGHPLWIADYSPDPPVPPPGWTAWTFWQYSDRGEVSGVAGQVDRDRYQGTEHGFQKLLIPGATSR